MSVPVRAIVVDDSASNEAILSEELQRGGFEPELRRVASREEMEEALAQGEWDVVLSDLSTTHLGAFEALTLLKERDVDIPFLIVSEALGEETAIRAMKAGAQNCIPRASLVRLWQRAVYGGESVATESVYSLCDGFARALDQPEVAAAPPGAAAAGASA